MYQPPYLVGLKGENLDLCNNTNPYQKLVLRLVN